MTVMTGGRARMMRRLAACGAALLLAGVAAPQAASAGRVAYPPGGFSLSFNLPVVEPGATVVARVDGCAANVTIQLAVVGTDVSASATCAFAAANELEGAVTLRGTATLTFQAPTAVGEYTVRATELGGQGRSATALLTVAPPGGGAPTTTVAGTSPAGGGVLPTSGSDTGPLMASAAAALLLGGGLAVVARRRRQRSAAVA